jgi:tetratricopeptide (TPR) repeat protein
MACEDYEKGAEYARLEARRYQKAGSLRDAVEYAKRSLACLEKLPPNEAVQKRIIDARVMLSIYYGSLDYRIEAKNAVEPIIDLARNLNYQKRLPGIYTAVGLYYCWVEEDFVKGTQYLKDVFEISAQVEDFLTLWFANYQLGMVLCFNHQFNEGTSYLKACLDLSLLSKNLTGIAHPKSGLAWNYNLQGKTNLALQISTEALQSATESGDVIALQPAYTSQGLSYYYKGVFHEAETYLLAGLGYYEKTAIGAWGALASGHLGLIYGDMEENEKAEKYYKKAILIFEETRFFPSWLNVHKLYLAKAKILNHQFTVDMHELNSLIAAHEKNRITICESLGARCIGEIFLHIDDNHMAEAETWIRRAIKANTGYGTKWNLARDHSLYADWFKKKGDIQGTKEQLTKAIDFFRECNADGWVTMTEHELTAIS